MAGCAALSGISTCVPLQVRTLRKEGPQRHKPRAIRDQTTLVTHRIHKHQPHVGKYIPYMFPTGHVQVMLHMYDARWPEGIITVPFWEPNRHSLAKVCSCRVFFYRPPRVVWSSVPHTCDKNWSAPVSATGARVCGIDDQTGADIEEFGRRVHGWPNSLLSAPCLMSNLWRVGRNKKSSFVLNLPWELKLSFLKQSLIVTQVLCKPRIRSCR